MRAEEEERMRLHAISLSNMGCFFMRNAKLHAALRCLDKASAASCKQTNEYVM